VNSISEVWFDAILRGIWQGTIVLALVWVVSRCVTALPASCRVWLWRLAFLKLLVALFWITPVPLPVLPAKQQVPALATQPHTSLEIVAESSPSFSAAPMPQSIDWRVWLLALWAVGVLWAIYRIARQWRASKMLLRNSSAVNDPVLNDILIRLAKALRLRRVPTIHQSALVDSPLLMGVFRPRIILPAATTRNSHIELMLAHELAHIRRRDLAWLWLFTVCEAIFFFHPLIWLARREWTISTETACDQLALRAANRAPHDYGSMLVEVVARMTRPSAPAVMSIGMFETANTLKRRLKAMTTNRTRLSTAIGIALVALGILALVPCRLVAEIPDAETLTRLKEENAKLRQQLEALRAEMDTLRHPQAAAKQAGEATEQQKRAHEELQKLSEKHLETARRLQSAHRELETLLEKFTQTHPEVLAKQRQVHKLQEQLHESTKHLDLKAPRGTRTAFVPAKPEDIERSRERRELLAREIELAERQVEFMRKKLENGKELPENLLRLQRELLELKLNQAELNGSKAERHAVLLQQLQVAEGLLKEQKKRVEVGTTPPGAEIAFEREVLRLKRELAER
jgi:beta-lactamase regulating signal transducer with metallopeptidase domain